MTLLVIGSTGTLGRQIVRRALDEGYQVRCLVRNIRKASFLKEWGAELIYGDLSIPDTIPNTLCGITAIVDASTARPSDDYETSRVDWDGKFALLEAAKIAKIKRFIFFSILNAEKYPHVPLMRLKVDFEELLKKSKIPYTIFHLGGFFQGLISQYAIPILENQTIYLTSEATEIAYIDTSDAAKFAVRSLSLSEAENTSFPLVGPSTWKSIEIVKLCENLSGQRAEILRVNRFIITFLKQLLGFFAWTKNIAERLAFIEVLSKETKFAQDMEPLYSIFNYKKEEMYTLEKYLQEYFNKIYKKIKTLNTIQGRKQKDKIKGSEF